MAGLENITVRKSGPICLRIDGVPVGTPKPVLRNYITNTLGVPHKCRLTGSSWLNVPTHSTSETLKFRNEEERDDAIQIIQTALFEARNLRSQPVNVPQLPPGFNPGFQPLTAPPGFVFNPGFRPFIPQAPRGPRAAQWAHGFNPAQQQAPGPYPVYQQSLPPAQQPVYGYAGVPPPQQQPQLQTQPHQPLGQFPGMPQHPPPPQYQQLPPYQPPPPPGAGWNVFNQYPPPPPPYQ